MNHLKIAVPDYNYHSFITIHLNNPSKNSDKDRVDNINYRQQITQKISSYIVRFFVKNGSKSNLFPIQYIYEKKTHQRWHLHILMTRLDPEKCIFDKKLISFLEQHYINPTNLDYNVIDKSIEYVFRRMKLNGVKIMMNGRRAFDIRRVWDVDGIEEYLSKYSEVRFLLGPQYEYEPFNSISL